VHLGSDQWQALAVAPQRLGLAGRVPEDRLMLKHITLRIVEAMLGARPLLVCTVGLRAEDRFAVCTMVGALLRWRCTPHERTVWS
jgi:hypothetical protein